MHSRRTWKHHLGNQSLLQIPSATLIDVFEPNHFLIPQGVGAILSFCMNLLGKGACFAEVSRRHSYSIVGSFCMHLLDQTVGSAEPSPGSTFNQFYFRSMVFTVGTLIAVFRSNLMLSKVWTSKISRYAVILTLELPTENLTSNWGTRLNTKINIQIQWREIVP